ALAGYYVSSTGNTSPTPASPGNYVATNGATVQVAALAGSYTPIGAMTATIPAPPGYFVATSGSASVAPAPIGSFSSGFGNATAIPDPPGRYTPVTGMAATIAAGDLDNDGIVSQAELNSVLTNYWPYSPWLSLTNFGEQCGGEFQFTLTN